MHRMDLLDLSFAFDTINHDIYIYIYHISRYILYLYIYIYKYQIYINHITYIHRLYALDISDAHLRFFKSYLSNHSSSVYIWESLSSSTPITCGV